MSFSKTLEDMEQQIEMLVQQVERLISDLPDNPRINRLASNPSCFTISSKDLFAGRGNLSPFYQDFKKQYEAVILMLRAGNPLLVVTRLRKIINGTAVVVSGQRTALHPDVLVNLQSILEKENDDGDTFTLGEGI